MTYLFFDRRDLVIATSIGSRLFELNMDAAFLSSNEGALEALMRTKDPYRAALALLAHALYEQDHIHDLL